MCCGVTSCECLVCLVSERCAVTVKWVPLNMFGTSWEDLSENVSLYTEPCLICASSFWKNGYAFHNAMFILSSIICDAVVRHVEMLVVVPQDIDQINGAYWKIAVVSSIIKVNKLLLKSVILGLDPDAFNARLFSVTLELMQPNCTGIARPSFATLH